VHQLTSQQLFTHSNISTRGRACPLLLLLLLLLPTALTETPAEHHHHHLLLLLPLPLLLLLLLRGRLPQSAPPHNPQAACPVSIPGGSAIKHRAVLQQQQQQQQHCCQPSLLLLLLLLVWRRWVCSPQGGMTACGGVFAGRGAAAVPWLPAERCG